MNKKFISMFFFAALIFGGCAKSSNSGATSPDVACMNEAIFSDVGDEVKGFSWNDGRAPALRGRLVRVNGPALKNALAGTAITLNLFRDVDVKIDIDAVQKVSADNVIAAGKISGDDNSAATLVLNKDSFVANIRRGNKRESYEVRYAVNGLHSVTVLDESQNEECLAEAAPQGMDSAPEIPAEDETIPPVIDQLVVYTPAALSKMGSENAMLALIQTGVADTNRAMADSGIDLSVRLVGTLALEENETGNWSGDLGDLSGKSDGLWDEVHAERARLGADQVSLVGSYSGTTVAGIGYIGATASTAFTISKTSAFSQYTFSHELGHNLGLNHSDGFVNGAGNFRTIIAYGTDPRIRRYSNPSLTYNGYQTGDSSHDEAEIINQNASKIAGLVKSVVPGAPPVPVPPPSEPSSQPEPGGPPTTCNL